MTQTLLSPSIITKESLVILENTLVAAKKVNRAYENQNKPNTTFKRGDTINVRKPNRFTVTTANANLAVQDIAESSVPVVVNTQSHVDFTFPTKDLTLVIEEFSDRYLKPAMAALANSIDYGVLQLYKDVYNQVGTPRSTPSTFAGLAAATRRLNEEAAPKDRLRTGIIDPAAEVTLADAFKLFYNPQGAISDQYEEAMIGRVAGADWFMDQNVALHTSGSVTNTTPAIDTTVTAGDTTLHMDGLNGATVTVKKGDTFTIAGIYAVNPQSRQTTGVLKQFVVTSDYAAVGSEFAALPYSPVMYDTGPYQNVTALPADGALVTFFDPGSAVSTQNLVFHRDAFTLVTVPLELPNGVHFAARESYKGINMRIVRQYLIADDTIPCRIDILWGCKCIYPELACRLAG